MKPYLYLNPFADETTDGKRIEYLNKNYYYFKKHLWNKCFCLLVIDNF